jgi:prolipoprotein diacylglyceryl transferase
MATLSSLASIGSPASGVVHVGSITIHLYGLMLLIAIATATAVTGVRWTRRGGDWDLIFRCAVWGVGFGIVGARLYHLATSWEEVPDAWWGPFAIWKGGLGVWGGIAAGCLAGAFVARRAGAEWRVLADCVAPGLLLAQGIGRIGNYFNQELFGRPTDLPWALRIDASHFPPGSYYPAGTTFHPTFLYELLWDFLAALVLLLIVERRLRPRPAGVFAAYIALYCFGRFWTELLRIDPAHRLGPLRLNDWVAIVGFVAAATWFLRLRRGREGHRAPRSGPRSPGPPRRGLRRPPEAPPRSKGSMAIPRGRR